MEFKLPDKLRNASLARYGAPAALLLVCLVQWALLFQNASPSWDAAVYYAYARSFVFDGDLHIANDLQLSYPTAAPDFADARFDLERTATGRVASPFAIGSAFVWLPWLAILRALAALGQLTGQLPQSLTGFEWYFRLGLASLSMALGWLAFWMAYKLARQVSERPSAFLATLTLLFATPLLHYMYAEALYAHATSAFFISLFVFVWWRNFQEPSSYFGALAIGLLLGLAILVRWQNLVYLVLPLSSIIGWWLSLAAGSRRTALRRAVTMAVLVALGAAAVTTLQLSHWRTLFGSWITIPQGASFMDWRAPYWRQVLFSTFKGLLPWMPIIVLSLTGLFLQLKKQRRFIIPLLMVLALVIYVNSSAADWFGGGGYGPRRFTSELPILVIGYAAFLQALPKRIRLLGGGLAAIILIVHQWLLLRFGLTQAIGGQVLSMAPVFRWSESGFAVYFQQIGRQLSGLFQRPLTWLHWPDAPLGTLYGGRVPIQQMIALAGTILFLTAAGLLLSRLVSRYRDASAGVRWAWLAALGALLLLMNLWILNWA